MASVRGPKRQLKNKALADALKANIVGPIAKSYTAIAFRVKWETTNEGMVARIISGKRRQLEDVLDNVKDIAMYISCINYFEDRKKKEDTEPEGEAEYYPSIAFWAAIHSGANVTNLTNELIRIVMAAGLDVVDMGEIKPRGKDKDINEHYAASLCTVIKDHDHFAAERIAANSTKHLVQQAAAATGVPLSADPDVPEYPGFTQKPVSVCFTNRMNNQVAEDVLKGFAAVNSTVVRLNYCFRDLRPVRERCHVVPVPMRPESPFQAAVSFVRDTMLRHKYKLVEGGIYKKLKVATWTYVYVGKPKDFLVKMSSTVHIMDTIIKHFDKIVMFMSSPYNSFFPTTKIDYNYIEVLANCCFDIRNKMFVHEPKDLDGSPRAYLNYSYHEDVVPLPTEFAAGIQNSFPSYEKRRKFYQKWYQLLLHKQFPMKEPKLMVVGPTDSGKSSWFYPFQGVIDYQNIAQLVEDGNFSCSSLRSGTEITYMDEWSEKVMSCDKAKIILQGGIMTIPRKHKDQKPLIYNSGFYITSNDMPNFGDGVHSDAVLGRLSPFHVKSLPKVDRGVAERFRRNAMSIIYYVALYIADMPLFESKVEIDEDPEAQFNTIDYDRSQLMTFEDDSDEGDVDSEEEMTADFPLARVPKVLVDITAELNAEGEVEPEAPTSTCGDDDVQVPDLINIIEVVDLTQNDDHDFVIWDGNKKRKLQ